MSIAMFVELEMHIQLYNVHLYAHAVYQMIIHAFLLK